ncbi:MAG: NAD(P)/FAD-dependent oxidoreductase [Archaeoglobaceae archaeon]
MIQIFGAGIAGTFLYHLLSREGYEVSIHDVRSEVDCRCAWAIAYREAKELYKLIDVDIDDYVLVKPDFIVANGVYLKNKNAVVFDKKKLLEDLWTFEFRKTDAELIVDATGAARAYLPPIENDRLLPTLQTLERHEAEENIYVYVTTRGYAWAFPLGDGRWHIGAGATGSSELRSLIEKLRRKYGFEERGNVCGCAAKVRMLPPSRCRPFVAANTVGVGEAIGCVSGAGEGNAPALISAKILFECLENLEVYENRILEEFEWIETEQKFVDAMLNGRKLEMLRLLPKIVEIERKRMVEHTVATMLKLLGL